MRARTPLLLTVILAAVTLVTSCGGGGSNSVGYFPAGGGNSNTASVAIVVKRATGTSTTRTMAIKAAPLPTMARIAVTNPNVNGISYKQIQDITIPGSTTMTIPIETGYNFELVTYTGGTPNMIEEYAITPNVQIQSGSNTITLTLYPITAGLTVPASIITGQSYTVTMNTSVSTGLQAGWRLNSQMTDYTKPLHLQGYYTNTNQLVLTAPVNNNQPGTVYFQAEFYLGSSMLKTGESYLNWTFVYPNPYWGDAPVSAPLLVPSGTVTITL